MPETRGATRPLSLLDQREFGTRDRYHLHRAIPLLQLEWFQVARRTYPKNIASVIRESVKPRGKSFRAVPSDNSTRIGSSCSPKLSKEDEKCCSEVQGKVPGYELPIE